MSKKDQRKGDENHGLEVIGNISLQIKVPYAWDFCFKFHVMDTGHNTKGISWFLRNLITGFKET